MTLVETLVATGTSCAVLFTVFTVSGSLSKQTDKDATRIPISSTGRATVDNLLYYLRSTQSISAASTATKVIITAPSYDPNASVVTTGVADTITFEFDSSAKALYETVATSGGTVRKAISRHVLAKNVESMVFTYYARQTFPLASFSGSGADTQTFTLKNAWKTGTTPTVALTVNGVGYTVPSSTMILSADAATRTITVSNVPEGVGAAEIRYEAAPGSSGLSAATQVNVLLKLLKKDSRQVDQVFTIAGSARLRNIPS